MIKKVFLACFCTLLLATLAWAADVSGKWTGKVPRRDEAVDTTFTFKVEGTTLTGAISNPQGERPIAGGKVEGDTISFTVASGQGGDQTYKGVVAGDEIK